MRKRRSIWIATAATLALLLAGGGAFAAVWAKRDGITKKQVLTFVDVTVAEDFIDVGKPAEGEFDVSPGDTFFFHDELWNRRETTQVGRVDWKSTFLIGTNAHCVATGTSAAGTIQLAQGISFPEEEEEAPGTFVIAITGGTEHYKNVVGQAELTELEGEENKSLLRLELIPSFRRP